MSLALSGLVLLAAFPAHAQPRVASLGKGWLLDVAGSITSTPGEVISGNNSIKGSNAGPDLQAAKVYLNTNPSFIHFSPNQMYTIALSYRIVTAASGGFEYGFFSSTANGHGHPLPTAVVPGAAGASGTATLTSATGSYMDVRVSFNVSGSVLHRTIDMRSAPCYMKARTILAFDVHRSGMVNFAFSPFLYPFARYDFGRFYSISASGEAVEPPITFGPLGGWVVTGGTRYYMVIGGTVERCNFVYRLFNFRRPR